MNHEPNRLTYIIQFILGAASYILWLVTAALGIVDLLLTRGLILEIARALDVNPWAHGAIDKFGLLILGIGWLILTYTAEAYYRRSAGVSLRKLLRSFGLVTVIQAACGGLAVLTTLLII